MNLQIHQHSLLTRKVFSWHNSSTQVFVIGSSSKLDHHKNMDHQWIIIIALAISIKWFYLSILLVTGSSTEATLFHVGCRPILHVGLDLQHLYLTMGGPTYHHVRKAQHFHLTMGGPSCHHVRKSLHLHLTMGGPAYHHVKMAPALISDHGRNQFYHVIKALGLITSS